MTKMMCNCFKLFMILMFLTGCTTAGNRAGKANVAVSAPPITHALAFQADPDFGKSLSSAEKSRLSVAERKALEYGSDGRKFNWTGDGPKESGTVVSSRPFRVGSSSCRRFEHNILIENEKRNLSGTACRKGNGNWKLIQ